MDDEIRQGYIEFIAAVRKEKHAFKSAVKFSEKMTTRKLKHTDKNIIIWDRALIVIRNYLECHYLEWCGAAEDTEQWFD